MKHGLCSLFLLSVIITAVKGQGDFREGYIITTSSDSIAGWVDYRSQNANEKRCYFRETSKSSSRPYSPSELKAYGFVNDKRYESKMLGGEGPVFAECVVKGALSLYKYDNSFFIQADSLIRLERNPPQVVKTQRGSYVREDKRYIGLLNLLVGDCHLTANNISYSEKSISRLIEQYNRCKTGSSTTVKQDKPWAQVHFQFYSGADISKLKIENLGDKAFKNSISPLYSVGIEIVSPRVTDKLRFSAELVYMKKIYQGYQEYSYSIYLFHNDYLIHTSFVKIPIGFRYNFLREDHTPYIKGGVVTYYRFDTSVKQIGEAESTSGIVTTTYGPPSVHYKGQNGYWISLGYSNLIARRLKGFVDFRWESGSSFIGKLKDPTSSSYSNINIILGLRF
jgi:hypothetical protein